MSHSRCSTVLGLLCHIYHFIVHQMCSTDERSGPQTGQFSTRTLLIWSHTLDAWFSWAFLVEIYAAFHKKMFVWDSMSLKICIYISVQAAFSIGNKVPPCHQRCWLFNWALTTSQMVQFLLSPEDVASMLSKKNSILRIVWQNSFYFILNELWSRDDSSVSGLCSSMTSSQHDKALTCTCG